MTTASTVLCDGGNSCASPLDHQQPGIVGYFHLDANARRVAGWLKLLATACYRIDQTNRLGLASSPLIVNWYISSGIRWVTSYVMT